MVDCGLWYFALVIGMGRCLVERLLVLRYFDWIDCFLWCFRCWVGLLELLCGFLVFGLLGCCDLWSVRISSFLRWILGGCFLVCFRFGFGLGIWVFWFALIVSCV